MQIPKKYSDLFYSEGFLYWRTCAPTQEHTTKPCIGAPKSPVMAHTCSSNGALVVPYDGDAHRMFVCSMPWFACKQALTFQYSVIITICQGSQGY